MYTSVRLLEQWLLRLLFPTCRRIWDRPISQIFRWSHMEEVCARLAGIAACWWTMPPLPAAMVSPGAKLLVTTMTATASAIRNDR